MAHPSCRNPSKYWLCMICVWKKTAYWGDECWWWTSLELVEQLEFRPSTSRKPSSRTPFDWDIQGRGHLLRFPKDPYGTGALGSATRLNVQRKGLNRGGLVAAWLKINIPTKGNNMLIQTMPDPTTQSQQRYRAHSLRPHAWRNFSQTEGDIEPSTWASTRTVAVAVGSSSSSQSSFGEIIAHFYVGVMGEQVGVLCKALNRCGWPCC